MQRRNTQTAVNRFLVTEKVKFGRFAQAASLMEKKDHMCDFMKPSEIEEHNDFLAELSLAKAAPRIGRNVQTAVVLGETLHTLSSAFTQCTGLSSEVIDDLKLLQAALAKVGDAEVDVTTVIHESLEKLQPDGIKEGRS